MNAARADYSRRLDWSAVKGDALAQLTVQVTRFVGGIRGPRQEGVSRKQILAWFSGTPEDFVERAIGDACAESRIRCCMRSLGSNSRANGGHVYVVDEPSEPLAAEPSPAAPSDMPKANPIQAVPSPAGFRLIRPGARYAVHRDGDARPGAWLPDGEAQPEGWTDVYPEDEARALLPFLRARATGGRPTSEPTTADGRLVARACKRLGLTAAGLAEKIGAHESVLSRARNGELPERHRTAIRALLKPGAKGAS